MSIQEQDLLTENLVAGEIRSGEKTASTASYFRGQRVGRVDATSVYGPLNEAGTYDVLNETDIPVGAVIVIDATTAISGTAVLVGSVLEVFDATDLGLAGVARDASAGLEKVRSIVSLDTVLAAEGQLPVYITGSELLAGGLVDASGDALTVTTAIVEACQDGGIVIK